MSYTISMLHNSVTWG